MTPTRVAWLPQVLDMDWYEAERIAGSWLFNQINGSDPWPVVVAHNQRRTLSPVMTEIVQRGRGSILHPRTAKTWYKAPVIAFVTGERVLDLAIEVSSGFPLVMIEGYAYPLRDWAEKLGAIDLSASASEAQG